MADKVPEGPQGPSTVELEKFLKAAPAPAEWTYEGYGKGGYVLSWTGKSALLEDGVTHTVRIHVHAWKKASGWGSSDWKYGGAWIEDSPTNKDVGFQINDVLKYDAQVAKIDAVANHHKAAIQKTMKERGDL